MFLAAMSREGLKVLNVAEKPSVAKEITRILGEGSVRRVSHGVYAQLR